MSNLIVDTREQQPWDFSIYGWGKPEVFKLDEGDYTTRYLYDIEQTSGLYTCRIERKASVSELAANIGKKKEAFLNELERLKKYSHKYLILEFPYSDILDFPHVRCIPPKTREKIKIHPNYLIKMISVMEQEYGLEVIHVNTREEAMWIGKDLLEEAQNAY